MLDALLPDATLRPGWAASDVVSYMVQGRVPAVLLVLRRASGAMVDCSVHNGYRKLSDVLFDLRAVGECSDDFSWGFTFTNQLANASTDPLPLQSIILDIATRITARTVDWELDQTLVVDWKLDLTLVCMHKWKTCVSLVLDRMHRSMYNDRFKMREWAELYGRDPDVSEVVDYFACLYHHIPELMKMLDEGVVATAFDEYLTDKGVNSSAMCEYAAKMSNPEADCGVNVATTFQIVKLFHNFFHTVTFLWGVSAMRRYFLTFVEDNCLRGLVESSTRGVRF